MPFVIAYNHILSAELCDFESKKTQKKVNWERYVPLNDPSSLTSYYTTNNSAVLWVPPLFALSFILHQVISPQSHSKGIPL